MRTFLITAAALCAMAWISEGDTAAEDQYCEMVGIWHQSGGEYGWPPERGEEHCD